jgi:hypothetical protein
MLRLSDKLYRGCERLLWQEASSPEQTGAEPRRVLGQLPLRQLRMQPTRAIRDAGEVSGMKRRRLKEAEHPVIHRRTRELHQVIDQRIAPSAIRMQEAACQIKEEPT